MSLRSDCARILRVLEPEGGGPRKFNVLAAMLGARKRAEAALKALRAEKRIRILYRNGGPHYALARPR